MKADILLQNIVNLFIISIVLYAAVSAIFSMSFIKGLSSVRSIDATRDAIIVLASLFLCYRVGVLRIFRGTGIDIILVLDVVISSLVLASMVNFLKNFMSRLRQKRED